MNEFRFICSRLILDEHVLNAIRLYLTAKVVGVERASSSPSCDCETGPVPKSNPATTPIQTSQSDWPSYSNTLGHCCAGFGGRPTNSNVFSFL